jgi:peptide/nickel transport system permease protein
VISFLVRRLVSLALLLLVLSFLTYALFFAGKPGNIAAQVIGIHATPTQIALTEHRLGLDHPMIVQWWHYVTRAVLHGNLGTDFQNQEPVTFEIRQALPVTASLTIGGAIIWLAIGIPIGIQSAVRPKSLRDRLSTVFALTFLSIPDFVLGLTMLFFLFYELTIHAHIHWFPSGTYTPITQSPVQWFVHLLLPWFAIALSSAAVYTRLMRASLLDVLGEDYMRTARAKGLSRRRTLYRHGVRSAMGPIVTQFGLDVGDLLGGAFITEYVFSLQGVGKLSLNALFDKNLPVVCGTILLGTAFVVIANAVIDVVYALLDPRVSLT